MLEEVGIPRLVVGGLGSGSGKTSISLGLTAALRARGRTVQTFKVGADFIDTAYLAHASRRPCRNLDSWLLGADGVRRSLAHGALGADCVIVEGAMGVLDGHGMDADAPARATRRSSPGARSRSRASSALRSCWSSTPGRWARPPRPPRSASSSSTARGSVVGVILNNVPNDYRRRVIEDAVWSLARMPVLGALPHIQSVRIPELRTGLLPLLQNPHVDEAIAELGDAVTRHCDLDLIERLMARARLVHPTARAARTADGRCEPVRIGVAFDDAFCFYYAENLELLEDAGAEIVTFSPLEDAALPRDLGLIYLGGGISEAFVPRLAAQPAVPRVVPARARARRAGLRRGMRAAVLGALAAHQRRRDPPDGRPDPHRHRARGRHAAQRLPRPAASRPTRCSAPPAPGCAATSSTSAACSPAATASTRRTRCTTATASHSAARAGPIRCVLASFIHLHFGQEQELAGRLVAAARESLDRERHADAAWAATSRSAAPV